jgi:hypothetical protein
MKKYLFVVLIATVAFSATLSATPRVIVTETMTSVTMGERNALDKAHDYLRVSHFSREGLIGQLEYAGFTHSEAVYGVDHCGADWFEQAAGKAEDYLRVSSFSRARLIDQLEYAGFTHEQAVYGVEAVGY